MRHQRILREPALFRLTLRKLGPLYFVPHLFLYGLIPLLGAGYLAYHGDGENARGLIFYDFQKFLPFFGCWWVLFGLASYVEGSCQRAAAGVPALSAGIVLAPLVLVSAPHGGPIWGIFSGAGKLLVGFPPLSDPIPWPLPAWVFSFSVLPETCWRPFSPRCFTRFSPCSLERIFSAFATCFSLSRVEHLSQLVLPYGPVVGGSILLVVLGSWAYRRRK